MNEEIKNAFDQWFIYYKQYINGYHMSDYDIRQLISLNHMLMEQVHRIHNDNMLKIGIFSK